VGGHRVFTTGIEASGSAVAQDVVAHDLLPLLLQVTLRVVSGLGKGALELSAQGIRPAEGMQKKRSGTSGAARACKEATDSLNGRMHSFFLGSCHMHVLGRQGPFGGSIVAGATVSSNLSLNLPIEVVAGDLAPNVRSLQSSITP
jgi:hypothetical protein